MICIVKHFEMIFSWASRAAIIAIYFQTGINSAIGSLYWLKVVLWTSS